VRGTQQIESNHFEGALRPEEDWHAHAGGQFILVESGISHLRTERGAWAVPARRVAWVPPGVRHASRSTGVGSGWVILPPVSLKDLPDTVRVLRASALLITSLQRLARLKAAERRMRHLLWRIVAAEMRQAQSEQQCAIPMPRAPRMLKAVQTVLMQPSAAMSLDAIAAHAGMSRRSFIRHFRDETGLSFTQWKRSVIAEYALELVASGQKVSSVAFDVGYESVSAFIAMFRRQYGGSPRRFLTERADSWDVGSADTEW
jgi:AraC-like DNA-binding protein